MIQLLFSNQPILFESRGTQGRARADQLISLPTLFKPLPNFVISFFINVLRLELIYFSASTSFSDRISRRSAKLLQFYRHFVTKGRH